MYNSDFEIDSNGVLIKYDGYDKNITVPDGVTEIGEDAFAGSLAETIWLPDSVVVIGENAFDNCEELKSIHMSSKIRRIENNAFLACRKLRTISIPEDIEYIAGAAFYSCDVLSQFKLPKKFTTITKKLYCGMGGIINFVIPDGITAIEDGAFCYCNNMQSISIPDSVTSIGASAFEWCESLKSITLPRGITVINKDTFHLCKSLTSIVIPEGVTTIDQNAFSECSSLETVVFPSTIERIASRAFSSCQKLASVILPNEKVKIASSSFSKKTQILYQGETVSNPVSKEPAAHSKKGTDSAQPSASVSKSEEATGKEAKKTASNKQAQPSAKEKLAKYDDHVSFNLPAGYKMLKEKNKDGEEICKIVYGPHKNSNGETEYDLTYFVNSISPEGTINILDELENKNADAAVLRRYSSNPAALLIISGSSLSILGITMVTTNYSINTCLPDNRALEISSLRISTEECEGLDERVAHLLVIWKSLYIDGQQIIASAEDASDAIKKVKQCIKGKTEKQEQINEAVLDNGIYQQGKQVDIGHRFTLELPYDWRIMERELVSEGCRSYAFRTAREKGC